MKFYKLLIAGGNSTLLVKGYKSSEKEKIISEYLGKFEQIGFVSYPKGVPKLLMMGNELSINGTIALASILSKSGMLQTSGYTGLVSYRNTKKLTKIRLNIKYKQIVNIVLLNGIGFVFLKEFKQVRKKYLYNLCSQFKLPAFGAIFYKENILTPYVYVKETNSLFKETACGSASIVLNVLTGKKLIKQPTGKIIRVEKIRDSFEILAEVTKNNERR